MDRGSNGSTRGERRFYVVTEKILNGDEPLRPDWDIEGTTGYDFLSLLNGLFVDRTTARVPSLYRRFTGSAAFGRSGFRQQAADSA